MQLLLYLLGANIPNEATVTSVGFSWRYANAWPMVVGLVFLATTVAVFFIGEHHFKFRRVDELF